MKREYPQRPIVGVGAVIIQNGKILLVKRGFESGKSKWSISGSLVEVGERGRDTLVREVKKMTLDEVHGLIHVVDNLIPSEGVGGVFTLP